MRYVAMFAASVLAIVALGLCMGCSVSVGIQGNVDSEWYATCLQQFHGVSGPQSTCPGISRYERWEQTTPAYKFGWWLAEPQK